MEDLCSLARMRKRKTESARIEALCTPEPNTGCWLWTGHCTHFGYGQMKDAGAPRKRSINAHRVAWRAFRGAIPEGKWVLHICHGGKIGCVNPAHLKLGSHAENTADMMRAGRQARGDRHRARLYPDSRARGDRSGRRMHPESWSAASLARPGTQQGEDNGNARLAEEDVRAIRELRAWGLTQQFIADMHGITQAHVSSILRGLNWKTRD